ncbi:MAG: DUF885 family protein [Proteobacteria bacterium]|nr:DUF885 family protein [Pseudomonadota bacterium]
MGFYEDPPTDKFGQLTYEMWRAVRLVVDTGLHHNALDAAAGHRPFQGERGEDRTRHHQRDRPPSASSGQALAHKIGELKNQAAARSGTGPAGEQFDVRAFHDVVLGSGAIPFDVLEATGASLDRESTKAAHP